MNSWILIKRILTWWMQRKLKPLLQPVSVMQWNGSILVSMHIQLRTLERTSLSSRECRHSTNVDFRSISHCVLLRPIGGVVFGIIGDKYGRKVVLTSTIILMAFSTLTIGLLPSYDQMDFGHQYYYCLQEYYKGFQQVESMRGNDICCRIISR